MKSKSAQTKQRTISTLAVLSNSFNAVQSPNKTPTLLRQTNLSKNSSNGNIVGKVLWWSESDHFGIIRDETGNEYYFDRTLIIGNYSLCTNENSVVEFKKDSRLSHCLCAIDVCIVECELTEEKIDESRFTAAPSEVRCRAQ